MFGHSTNNTNDQPHAAAEAAVNAAKPGVAPADMGGFSLPTLQNNPSSPAPSPTDGPTEPSPVPQVSPAANPAAPVTPHDPAKPKTPDTASDTHHALAVNDALLDIKQQALQKLSPLIDHLDQTPEEKFRTTMMMIQAADDQTLIKDAYAAAQSITDEKVRAQALLDVVNEINYFTQQQNK
ncbi:hypothetical protein CR970_02460 [Candidatus Saccharibacteria bacterium]|nr:MAG: hypothetical protein CR970_02460 [Candidatus Saccharibacteria bacterium]